jgi:NADH-quinone oxidoreductase subunit L
LLFLAAGCVIQALADEHDIFRMGNLKKYLPGVYWLFLIGVLCLSAFPLIGGFFSKDRILLALFMRPEPIYKLLWLMGFIGALLTPLYAMRLFFIVFSDRPEGGRKSEVKPIPKLMVLVLWPLAVLALFDGLLNLPFGPGKRWLAHYMSSVPGAIVDLGASSAMSWALGLLDSILVLVVIAGSYFLFRAPLKTQRGSWVHRLLFSGFHLDRLYDRVLVVPYQAISKFLWVQVDAGGLDRGVEAGAGTIASFSAVLNLWNTGRLSTYLIMFFVGFVALLYFLVLVWLGL